MSLKIAYFQPTVLAIDTVPPVEYSKIYSLAQELHSHPELNDSMNPFISIRGGQQIQVYPNELNIDVGWLVKWLESIANGYMEIISQQSGTEELKLCKPVVTSVWTIQQTDGQYQELHTHPGGNLSGNIYITAPEFAANSEPSDGHIAFRLPETRDVTKFIMNDTWKYAPTPGTVILFPSHLPHTVYPWHGTGTRTVMAFDIRLVPKEQQ
jgi:uncharacterized protein (TIGR02466 family)